jgi:hypothetical protein
MSVAVMRGMRASSLGEGSLAREVAELRAYVMREDRRAETEAERTRLRGAFSDAERAAINFGQPKMAQAFAVGGQMVATAQAMSAASVVGASAMTCAGAVGAGVLLVSMFASMDAGDDDALQDMQKQMQTYFIGVSHQIRELQVMIERNHAEEMHQFRQIHQELSIVGDAFKRLSQATQEELYHVRGDFAVRCDQMTAKIASVARTVMYSLEECRLDKFRETEDAIIHYESRALPVDKLRKKVAYLERWLSNPPANKLLTGAFYIASPDQRKYLESSSLAGRVAILGHVAKAGEEGLVNLDVFESVLPIYLKALKCLRLAGESYDLDGKMWTEKVIKPLEACERVGNVIDAGYERNVRETYRDVQIHYDEVSQTVKDLLAARSRKIAEKLSRELREEVQKIFLDMESPLHPETTNDPFSNGGMWFVDNSSHIQQRLKEQREEAIIYAAVAVTPYDLFEERGTEVNLKGRFARLLPIRDDVYLYPTYLPLEGLPISAQVRTGLEAEKLGLGKLKAEARLVGRFEANGGRYLYASAYPKDARDTPTDPYWISLQWSFVDEEGKEISLKDERFSLNFNGCEQAPYVWFRGGNQSLQHRASGGDLVNSRVWNGDALSTSIFNRWRDHSSRVQLKESELEPLFASCEASLGTLVYGADRSHFIRFPARRASQWTELNATKESRILELRRELLDPSKGDPVLKAKLNTSLEDMKRAHLLHQAFKEHQLGPQPFRTLTVPLCSQPLELLLTIPSIRAESAYATQLTRIKGKAELWRAEVLAVPLSLKEVPAAVDRSEVAALAARVDELTRLLAASTAMLEKLMRAVE